MTPDSLSQMLSDFLAGTRRAVVIEDGAVVFELSDSKYSISGDFNKCLLHLWSHERNCVRRVLDAQIKADTLRLQVQRMGQSRPTKLEFCRDRDRRSPAARQSARTAYVARLRRALERNFPGWYVVRLTTSMDLEHSFGPAYVRGLMQHGQSALAIVGVNSQEMQSTIDGALTCGLLWLEACRNAQVKRLVEGLVLILPHGAITLTQQRMAHLHPTAAKWHLYEFDERNDSLNPADTADCGNLATHLVHATDENAACERFADSIARIRSILPQCDVSVLSPALISFRLHGLEFAQARVAHDPRNFQSGQEIVFGIGSEERILDERKESQFADLLQLAASIRHKDGPKTHALWRMHPERWLEAMVIRDVETLDGRLRGNETGQGFFAPNRKEFARTSGQECPPHISSVPHTVYSQVPAFSAADRAMIDVLTITREHRLAVIELKADEDIHLPLQGVDYWARVAWHQERGEFRRFGYFPGLEISMLKPHLFLVAPALHVHPATDTILRYFSPEIEWELLGIDEHWREEIKVVFRKRAGDFRNASVAIKTA